jgi:Icc-related predicted phosphoesterase
MISPSGSAIILAVSDDVSQALNTCNFPAHIHKVDFIISCGDLPFDYLEFLMSCHNAPMYYVLGNHDTEGFQRNDGKISYRPEAGDSLEGCTRCVNGILIAGLGGSIRYGSTLKNQFTEAEMWRRVLQLTPNLIRNQARYGRRLDIFVTHSPARGIHEGEDPAHRGFAAFRWLLDYANPRWMLHGHTQFTRPTHDMVQTRVGYTAVIYVPPYRLLRWEGGKPE